MEIFAPILVGVGMGLLVLAGIGVSHPRLGLGWLGLAAWAAAELILMVT